MMRCVSDAFTVLDRVHEGFALWAAIVAIMVFRNFIANVILEAKTSFHIERRQNTALMLVGHSFACERVPIAST